MALWVDGSAPEIGDLEAYESDIVQVATIEGIDLERKLALGRQAISTDLAEFLRKQGGEEGWGCRDVVVTEALRRWGACVGLAGIYRDAHLKQLSDRYRAKWKEYERLAGEARRELYEMGVGRVRNPLRRPGAPVVAVSSGGMASGTYYFRASFVNGGGSESEASELTAVSVEAGSRIEVWCGGEEGAASGWHVYAGTTAENISRQTTAALPLGSSWIVGVLASGVKAPAGQEAEYWTRARNILWRG